MNDMINREDLKHLLDGLDVPHAELIHSRLSFDFVTSDLLLPMSRVMVERYRLLSERFFKRGDVSVLPEMNVLCCDMLSAIEVEEQEFGISNRGCDAIESIKKLANRPIRAFDTSFSDALVSKWKNCMTELDDVEVVFRVLSPLLLRTVELVETGCFEVAAGNLFLLFDCLNDVRLKHGEWFEHLYAGGQLTDVEFMTDVAAEVYCHLRQKSDLPKELGEDMDNQLLLQNQKTGFFGDWTLNIYADMLYTLGYQSGDYSSLDKMDAWQEFQTFVRELAA